MKYKLNLNDSLKMEDVSSLGSFTALKGHVKIKDKDTGEIYVDKDNLILLRTRLLVMMNLLKLDNVYGLEDAGYKLPRDEQGNILPENRKLCLFKVGSGGADITSTPFQPYVPKFNDSDLSKPVGFVYVTDMKDTDPDFQVNPSILTQDDFRTILANSNNETTYYRTENMADKDITAMVTYDAKSFRDAQVEFNPENNILYADLDLEISDIDCRGEMINELGLLMAEVVYQKYDLDSNGRPTKPVKTEEGKNVYITEEQYDAFAAVEDDEAKNYFRTYRNEELATRITFDTISLKSLSKSLIIEYRIYV